MIAAPPPGSDAGNRPYRPLEKMLARLKHLPHRGRVAGALSFDKVRAEIDKNRPVAAHIIFPDESGHFVVIAGYDSASRRIQIRDSDGEDGWPLYEDVRTKFATIEGAHWTISYKTMPKPKKP